MEIEFLPLQSQPSWLLLLLLLGLLSVFKSSISLLKWVFITFIRPAKNLKKYGSWALVTGPTDGIGKSFAFQLAQKGLHLILVGRSPDKLRDVSESIRAKFNQTQIRTVVVDFSSEDLTDGIERIGEAIEGLDVGVLVNNVGVSTPEGMLFHEVEEEVWKSLIRVNIEGTTKVTQTVLKGMIERKRGAIVNIGSGSSVVRPSLPFIAVYAATKAYVNQLSRSLYVEYKNSGIHVQCQIPLYVATKMVPFKRSSFFTPSPDAYAAAAIRWIGCEASCSPYWKHSIQRCLASLLPDAPTAAWCLSHGIRHRFPPKQF